MDSETNTLEQVFGKAIYTYSRAQAIEDGVLADASEMGRQAGIKHPVAVTVAVYDEYVRVPKALKGLQDEAGRLWDILWMFAYAVRSQQINGNEGLFEVSFLMWEGKNSENEHGKGRQEVITLKAVCGPNDDASPCITIMKPDED